LQSLPGKLDAIAPYSSDGGVPQQTNTAAFGALDHSPMQRDSPQPDTAGYGKPRLDRTRVIPKPDPADRVAITGRNGNSKSFQRRQAFRQQALAACFVNWWGRTIRNGDVKTFQPRSDRGRKASRSAPDDKHICRC
jgi:hypothetical protein